MCNTIYVSNATTTDTGVILIPNRTVTTLTNCGCYRLIICYNVTATSNLPVYIQTSLGNVPVLCRAGNVVYANQLQKRKNYGIMYGDGNALYTIGQIVIQDKICSKAATPAAAVASETSEEINPSVNDTRKTK